MSNYGLVIGLLVVTIAAQRAQGLGSEESVTLGGPVNSGPAPKPTAPRVQGPNPWVSSTRTVPIHTQVHPPATSKLEDLPLKESVSQYGITWTFDQPARVGQFINGDWYVV